MRQWLKITAIRLVIIGAIIAGLAVVLVYWPAGRAKNTIARQADETSQAINVMNQLKDKLSSLPRADQITLQQVGSFKNYADQTESLSDKLSHLKFDWQKPNHITGYSNTNLISDTNEAINSLDKSIFDSSESYLISARRLAKYNAEVSKALINILEYNPADDTKVFELGTDDTSRRLSLAKNGLGKTLNQLEAIRRKYDYRNISELIRDIHSLQTARDNLARSGDTNAWISAVNEKQLKIVNNIQNFWAINSTQQISLSDDNLIQITKLNQLWLQLKQKYRI